MTPPPSATADYDAGYQYAPEDIHAMMAEVTAQQGNAFWRAIRARTSPLWQFWRKSL